MPRQIPLDPEKDVTFQDHQKAVRQEGDPDHQTGEIDLFLKGEREDHCKNDSQADRLDQPGNLVQE